MVQIIFPVFLQIYVKVNLIRVFSWNIVSLVTSRIMSNVLNVLLIMNSTQNRQSAEVRRHRISKETILALTINYISLQVMHDRYDMPHYPTLPHITPHYPTLPHITPHYPTLPHITPHYPTLPHITPHYPTLPNITPHYPTLPHITQHYPTSPNITPHQPTSLHITP